MRTTPAIPFDASSVVSQFLLLNIEQELTFAKSSMTLLSIA